MSTMGLPLQAHTNVRDVLAPLFSNGRSFASLIDELSRHFKLEPKCYGAYGDDPAGVLEASSESQSTDSEAEGNMSDEADSQLVQARVSAQAHSSDAAAARGALSSPLDPSQPPPPSQLPTSTSPSATTAATEGSAPPQAHASTRKTRSRSRQQQQQQQQQQPSQSMPAAPAAVNEAASAKTSKAGKGEASCSGDKRSAPPVVGGGGGGGKGGGGNGAALTKSFVSGDDLTVLSVTANADGWSEAVGAALATRARAGYVFAQEVEPDSPQSTEFVREVFLDERSGARKALELRMRLIPVSQKVLLCSAWVDSGEYLAAAARLVVQCQAEVFGIACVRFEQNRSTEGLVDRFNLFAKSMPKGSVPSLNMGMKSCIPASLTKGFHGYTYNRGGVRRGAATLESGGAAGVDGGSGGGGGAANGAAVATPPPGNEVRQDRAKKRRRKGAAVTDSGNADAVPASDSTPIAVADTAAEADGAAAPEPMDEDSVTPAADEVSAGEGLAEPGNGGLPAQRQRYGGGAMSESEKAAGGAGDGGGGWRQLVGGAILSEEDHYAADSERSTDHESMHLYGGGGRESDEHDLSEREAFRRGRGRGGGTGGRRGRGRSSGRTSAAERGDFRTSSPETGLDADGENSSGRNSAPGVGGGSQAGASKLASPKRSIGTGIGAGTSGGPRGSALLDETGEHSGSLAHSEASGSGGAEEEAERHEGDAKDAEVRIHVGDGDGDRDRDGGGGGGGGGGSDIGAVAPLEWKAKLGRQPIFMSRGLPEEDTGLLPSHSEGGTHGTGSPGRSGAGGLSRPIQDPEDDRDRASSCSSADSPIRSGGIVLSGSRGSSGGRGAGCSVDGRAGRRSKASSAKAGEDEALPHPAANALSPPSPPPTTMTSSLAAASPNSPGGTVPWHHTSVYEANNPTEDRHAELSHDALGVKIYCVCDGHGGSRAAQFVCDNLAANVLSRVQSIASAAATTTAASLPQPPPQDVARELGAGDGSGAGDADGGGGGWAVNDAEIRRSLAEAFESCDEEFIAQLDPTKNKGYINAGCCVVLALLVRSKLYVAHVGDCRVVLGTTDAARFSPKGGSPSTPTGSKERGAAAAATTMTTGKRGGGGGDGGSGGRGRGGKGASGMRVGSPLRGGAAAGGGAEVCAVALSRDHNCDDADEAAFVRARSGDENAIRVSRNDEWKGARAIKRVAGSLAVTRAIGDAYLKKAAFSFSPYKEGVPYITAEPAVTAVELTSKDRFLVLATDGVWEQVSNEEAVRCVSGALGSAGGRRQRSTANRTGAGGGAGSYTSDALVDLVLARSAQSHGMSVPALRALPRGQSRRQLHDDVCATVVHFTPAPAQPARL